MKSAIFVSSLFVAAACGGKSKPAGGGPDNVGKVAPAWAALFVQGAGWNLSVVTEDSGEGEEGPETNTSDPVTVSCNQSNYTEAEGITSIEITCGDGWPEMGGDPLTGAWAMSAKGVWRLEAFPGAGVAPELRDEDMFIAAAPVQGTVDRAGPQDPEGPTEVDQLTLEQKDDAWCRMHVTAMGDESWESLCVGPDGPTEGNWGWGGGSVHEAKFTVTN